VKPRLASHAFLIRFADDFVIGFRDERDAQRAREVIPKRFGKYGLTIHPTKTKLVPFRPPSSKDKDRTGPGDRPGTFDFLGFTHYWALSLKGYWVVKLKTAKDRFSRAVKSVDRWCYSNRHLPLREQQQKLNQKLRGHYAYYGVTGNSAALARFLHEVRYRWRKWLAVIWETRNIPVNGVTVISVGSVPRIPGLLGTWLQFTLESRFCGAYDVWVAQVQHGCLEGLSR